MRRGPENFGNYNRSQVDPNPGKGRSERQLELPLGERIQAGIAGAKGNDRAGWREVLPHLNTPLAKAVVGAGLFTAGAFLSQLGPVGDIAGEAAKAAAVKCFGMGRRSGKGVFGSKRT